MSNMQPVRIRSAVFFIVCSYVMLVVDAIGDHIAETYSSVNVFTLCMSPCVDCSTWSMKELLVRV